LSLARVKLHEKKLEEQGLNLDFLNPKLRNLNDVLFRLYEEKVNEMSFVSLFFYFDSFGWLSWQHQNAFIWSYRPPNWARLNPNEKCAPPLPALDGLRWRWHNFSNEASKVGNSVSLDGAPIMQKLIWFSCVHTQKPLNGFLLRVYNTSLKTMRLEMDSRPPKILAKPYK
jgi:hypothetical protein